MNSPTNPFSLGVARATSLLLTMLVGSSVLPAQNVWTQWSPSAGGNGHWYLVVRTPGSIDWNAARSGAQTLGGDLATITSAAENAFVFSLLSDPGNWRQLQNPTRVFGPWLGGFQTPGAASAASGWTWISGETWSYTSWSSGEPNDYQGMPEDRLHYFAGGTAPQSNWNDLQQTGLCPGFVVESYAAPIAAYLSIGTGCAAPGGTQPTLGPATANDLPRLGTTSLLRVGNLPSTTPLVVFALGTGNVYTDLGGTPVRLPVALGVLGWTGCNLLIDPQHMVPQLATGASADLAIPVPALPTLVGSVFFAQALVLDGFGVALTPSIAAAIGA